MLDSGTMKNVCEFGEDPQNNQQSRSIKILGAFKSSSLENSVGDLEYKGRVRIFFRAVTPAENKYRETFTLAIYDTSSFAYKIDEIDDGLFTTFACGYPCQTCDLDNPTSCSSCYSGFGKATYMQRDKVTGVATCK